MQTCRGMQRTRLFSTLRVLQHENPLGLPRKGAPPQLPRMRRGLPEKRPIRDVKKIIAVSSAKGGVGKSTLAANLAICFAQRGFRSGILDADIFGPSIPTLFNLSKQPRLNEDNELVPLSNYGVKTMSIGYLVRDNDPIVWRGLMVMKAIQQLLHEVDWGGLDILVLDLPPGTGDVQLTITQQVKLDGAIIVSTPNLLSIKDSVKGINMFKKVEVPILGMVQNMATFTCPECGTIHNLFGHDGVYETCKQLGMNLIGDIPLHPKTGEDADAGKPTVAAEPEGNRAKAFHDIAGKVVAEINLQSGSE